MSTAPDDLRERARALGVETSYWDVQGGYHEASAETLAAIVEVLTADAGAPGAPEPVVVGRPADVAVGPAGSAELVLDDGTRLELQPADGRVALPPDLPVGCHRVATDDGEITVVVPPPAMPRDPDLAGRAGLF